MKRIKGQCFLVPSGPNQHLHLFTIVIEPAILPERGNHPQVISVNFTSVIQNVPHDKSCLVDSGDHPFIKHPSYVNYRGARCDSYEQIQKLINNGVFIEKEPCSDELLKKIINGALASKMISREFKDIIRNSLINE